MKVKNIIRTLFVMLLGLLLLTPLSYAQDMRENVIEARKKREELLKKARIEKERALREKREAIERILKDKNSLLSAIKKLKKENERLKRENKELGNTLDKLKSMEKELISKRDEIEENVKELVGVIRVNAKDIDSLFRQSLQSAFLKDRIKFMDPILSQIEFPGMGHVRRMVDLLFKEIELSGQVRVVKGNFVDRSGKEVSGNILILGNFSAAYRIPEERGFLLYSDTSQRLFALSKLPPHRISKKLIDYMEGRSIDVPIAISRGAALRQLTHRLSLIEHIPKGGPLVWPIVGIAAVAFLIIIERSLYLSIKDIRPEKFADLMLNYASRGDWDSCLSLCKKKIGKPISRVLLSGIKNRGLSRQDLENVLQEAILNEIPPLERFLSTLGMLAAISPLLGLLGTVTGMIKTFHVITFYGTGDPKMMSAGISEALVTTMLGLSVAIPVMLFHTLLTRKVENMISQMEKKSIAFVNTLFSKIEEG
ncbi:MAG TPA: DUF3450 family protein [Desulfobacteraceae bacterium]|nr:DUF3450 family protein [Desulfobacteraceae bacterium]